MHKTKTKTCLICPKVCKLAENEIGNCNARQNKDNKIKLLSMNRPCSIAVDPMEKKPLYHFYPGENILSLGMAGCNLHCKNCQNSQISQTSPLSLPFQSLTAYDLPIILEKNKLRHVAYTYTEPLVAYEYVKNCSIAVKRTNGTNTLVTAGYINSKPLIELLPFIDAINLDIKAMDNEFYRTNCDITLAPVLRNAEIIKKTCIHLEITNLILPTLNDSDKHFELLSKFILEHLGKETVLHFSAFFPTYKRKELPPTPLSTLERAANIAKSFGLYNVYIGNAHVPALTLCPNCSTLLIERDRYLLKKISLDNGTCPHCHTKIYGVYNA